MSILPQALRHSLAGALRFFGENLLPGSCLLCRANSQQELLCADCIEDLPQHTGPYCTQCAEPLMNGELCATCLKNPPHFDLTIAHFRYDFPVDRIIHALKYGHQLSIAQWLGKRLATQPRIQGHDCMMAMPLHPERLRERGFNQSIEIGRVISRLTRQPLRLDSLQRIRATAPQAGLALKERHANVRGAFACTEDLSNRSVLLLDDVMTTGATLNECARVLKLHGARHVTVAVAARALRHD